MRILSLWLFLLLVLPLFFSIEAGAQTKIGEMEILAQDIDYQEDQVYLNGDVRVVYKQIRMFADYAAVNVKTKDVHARGNVTIHILPDEVIRMEEMNFNLDSGIGEMTQVHGMVQPTITYEADSVVRESEDLYRLQRAWITSCTQTSPRWSFSSSKADFKKNDYVAMWNSVFRIKKIPIFYLPYMRYPLDRDRSTGFLIPQMGYNGRKGLTFSQAFYWAMRRNMDATVNLDFYSSRGLGGGLEYRYLFPRGIGGQLNLFYFIFKNREEFSVPENAYIVRFKHNQTLPFQFKLVADVDYQSSFDFLREFDNNFRRAVVSNRRSQVYLSRAWSTFNLTAQVSRFETFFTLLDRAIIKKNIPQVDFRSSKVKIFDPIYFSFDSSLYGWEYGYDSAYKLGTQKRGRNLSFSPAITVPINTLPWLTLNSTLASHFAYYFQSFIPNTKTSSDEGLLSRNYSLRLEATGPVFYRVYNNADQEPVLKHIIEPNFVYRYESPVEDADRIVTQRFFFLNHFVQYGITNRFLIRKNKMPREVLTLGISQNYYLSPEFSPLQVYRVDGKIPEFSDIDAYLRFYPSSKYSLDFSAGVNPYHLTLSRVRLGGSFGQINDNLFFRINWYKSINPYYESMLARNQIGIMGGVKIPALSLELMGDVDFNIQERKMLYSAVSFIYHYQCIDIISDFKIYYFRDKPEIQFRITFGLGNIGKTTDFLSGDLF